MAWNYILMGTIFRELYRQDLLDTTYYAHDSFLSNKRTVSISAGTREQIESLTNRVIGMCDANIKANPNDKNSLFAAVTPKACTPPSSRSPTTPTPPPPARATPPATTAKPSSRSTPSTPTPTWPSASSSFAVASLPRIVRMMVGIMGVGGNKEHGLELLREAAAHGVVTSVESRTALSLFLRHDGRYPEALVVQRGLAQLYPHDYLFRLEVANLLKDEGHGLEAIAEYRKVLDDAAKPGYFAEPRLQLAWFGMADTQRGYNDIKGAAYGYMQAAMQPNCSDWLRKRAQLNAGQMYDLLHDRNQAVRMYQMAASGGDDQTQADAAHKYLKTPFTGK